MGHGRRESGRTPREGLGGPAGAQGLPGGGAAGLRLVAPSVLRRSRLLSPRRWGLHPVSRPMRGLTDRHVGSWGHVPRSSPTGWLPGPRTLVGTGGTPTDTAWGRWDGARGREGGYGRPSLVAPAVP